MIQLYYLADPEREHRLDSLFRQLDAVVSFFPVVSATSFTTLVTRDKAIRQQDFLVCDLTDIDWSDEHILSAVQLLRRFSVVKPVFLAPPSDRTTTLFGRLADQRVDGLVLDTGEPEGPLAAILQGDPGYARRLAAMQQAVVTAANQAVSPLRIPPGLVVNVSVCGAMPRTGTTTQTIALYHYLSQLGFRPALLDSGQPSLAAILALYQDRAVVSGNTVTVNGIRVVKARSPDYNAYLTDHGVLTPEWAAAICAADLTVLVGGVKPWELPQLATAYATLSQGRPRELVTLVSFAAPDDASAVADYIKDCACVAYHPDLWAPASDSVYRSAVLPHLLHLCGQA